MDSFWVKIIILGVVIAGLAILIKFFSGKERPEKLEPSSFSETIAKDDKRLRAEPEYVEPPEPEMAVRPEPVVDRPVEQTITEPPRLQFRKLTEIEEIEASRLFEFAINQRKIGRLPGTGYKPMVDACRNLIEKFPGSFYEFKARRMLGDINPRYWKRYKITKEEVDLGNFK